MFPVSGPLKCNLEKHHELGAINRMSGWDFQVEWQSSLIRDCY